MLRQTACTHYELKPNKVAWNTSGSLNRHQDLTPYASQITCPQARVSGTSTDAYYMPLDATRSGRLHSQLVPVIMDQVNSASEEGAVQQEVLCYSDLIVTSVEVLQRRARNAFQQAPASEVKMSPPCKTGSRPQNLALTSLVWKKTLLFHRCCPFYPLCLHVLATKTAEILNV